MADTAQPQERPKLKLLPKGHLQQDANDTTTEKKSDPFGGARPREQNVSQEREARYKEKEAELDFERQAALAAHKAQQQATSPQPQTHQQQQQQQQLPHYNNSHFSNSNNRNHHHHNNNNNFRNNNNNNNRDFSQSTGSFEDTDGFQTVGNDRKPRGHYQQQQPRHFNNHFNNHNHNNNNTGVNQHNAETFGNQTQQQQQQPRSTTPPEGYVCNLCHETGHWIKDCAQYIPKAQPTNNFHHHNRSFNNNNFNRNNNYHNNNNNNSNTEDLKIGIPNRFPLPEDEQESRAPRVNSVPPETYTCRICNVGGHWIQNCPQKVNTHNNNNSNNSNNNNNHNGESNNSDIPPTGYCCKICGIPGHYIKNCSSYRPGQNNKTPIAVSE